MPREQDRDEDPGDHRDRDGNDANLLSTAGRATSGHPIMMLARQQKANSARQCGHALAADVHPSDLRRTASGRPVRPRECADTSLGFRFLHILIQKLIEVAGVHPLDLSFQLAVVLPIVWVVIGRALTTVLAHEDSEFGLQALLAIHACIIHQAASRSAPRA